MKGEWIPLSSFEFGREISTTISARITSDVLDSLSTPFDNMTCTLIGEVAFTLLDRKSMKTVERKSTN